MSSTPEKDTAPPPTTSTDSSSPAEPAAAAKSGKYVPPHQRGRSTEPQGELPPYVPFRRNFSPPAPANRYVPPPVAAAQASGTYKAGLARDQRSGGGGSSSGGGSYSSGGGSYSNRNNGSGGQGGWQTSRSGSGYGGGGQGRNNSSSAAVSGAWSSPSAGSASPDKAPAPRKKNAFAGLDVEEGEDDSAETSSKPSGTESQGTSRMDGLRLAFGSPRSERSGGNASRPVTMLFGDSYIGMFSLVDSSKSATAINITKYKGATASGVGKTLHENRLDAEQKIQRSKGRVKALIFNFGQVDVHLSFYYKRYIENKELETERIVKSYVDFAATVGGDVDCPRIVLAVYPCPVLDKDVLRGLLIYHVITDEDALSVDPNDHTFTRAFRAKLLADFNSALEKECKARGVIFLSINDQILDETGEVKPMFRDISIYNIHLLWEPTIVLWTKVLAPYGISDENLTELTESWSKYEEYKTNELKAIDVTDLTFAFDKSTLKTDGAATTPAGKDKVKDKDKPDFFYKRDD